MRAPLALVALATASLAACGHPDPVTDAGSTDVHTVIDTGPPPADAAPPTDTGTPSDSSTPTDTGTPPGDSGPASDAGSTAHGPRDLFPSTFYYYRDVSGLMHAPESDAILMQLASDGGWGNGNVFQIDFSITVLSATSATPTHRATSITYGPPDSDDVPLPFPPGGAVEGETGYACTGGGDCHLLVIEQDTRTLYEGWAIDLQGGTLTAGGIVAWNLDRDYGPTGRGAGCTSADAAGFPLTPGLIGVDEVAAGEIRHALRFILPNARMRRHAYVAPATHYGAPSNRNVNSIPYGTRLRLRPGFDESTIATAGGRAVIRALKRYGMLLADGGNIALTAESDQFTTAKWSFDGGSVALGPHDLRSLQVSDFEVVDFGTVQQPYPINDPMNEWPDCVRNP